MAFCTECGIKLDDAGSCPECVATCKTCGAKRADGTKFCANCGAPATLSRAQNVGQTKQVTDIAVDHAKQATVSAVSTAKSLMQLPNFMTKVAAGLSIAAIILTLFPWAGIWGFTVSGFSAAFMFKQLGIGAFFFLCYLACVACSAWAGIAYFAGKMNIEKAQIIIISVMGIGFVILVVSMLYTKSQLYGYNVFTGWFYLEILITAAAAALAFADRKKDWRHVA